MSEKHITMDELILYLGGEASDPLIKRIEQQRAEDEEFNEEMEEWESRLQEEGNPKALIEQMKHFETVWQSTEVPVETAKKIAFPRWIPLAIAAGFALLLLAYFNWQGRQGELGFQFEKQLAAELDSKVALLIGPEAGITDPGQEEAIKQQLWESFEREDFEVALQMVDSLILKNPDDLNNLLLKGLIFEKYGKSEKALATLEMLSSKAQEEIAIGCESLWYQCLILGKTGQKVSFLERAEEWKESRCGELDAGRMKQLEHIKQSI